MFVLQNRRSNSNRNMNMYNDNQRRREISFTVNRFTSDNVDTVAKNNETTPRIKEMTWGEPTWYLFHTLAEKVDEQYFNELKDNLITLITRICNNLPCPDCSLHASNYLSGVNFFNIKTKEDLKRMLWQFHNSVNNRKKYDLFTYDELNKKYSQAQTMNIIKNFFYHFSKKQYNIRLSMENMTRRTILKDLQTWLEKNTDKFHP